MKKYLIDFFKLDLTFYPLIKISDGTPLIPSDPRPHLYNSLEEAIDNLNSHKFVSNDLKCIFEIETDHNDRRKGKLVYIEGKQVSLNSK